MENTTSMNKLTLIQSELKAPKGQYNDFAKFKYRSCEDILEALKPLLKATDCFLTISDDIQMVGDRIYVVATATLVDNENKQQVSVKGFAREAEDKKGMDASQITGAASSYARKYALNGLFCIDDTKDADTKDNTAPDITLHLAMIAKIDTEEALKDYWLANKGLGSEFGKAVTARKKELGGE